MGLFFLDGGQQNALVLAYPAGLFVSLEIVGEIKVSTLKLLIYAYRHCPYVVMISKLIVRHCDTL